MKTKRASKEELAKLDEEIMFWYNLMPKGFKLHGWTYKNSATLIAPDNRQTIQVTASILRAMKEGYKS